MYNLKWKKVIIKDKFLTGNGTVHNIQKVYIALCNAETGEYLISLFSDFLNEFADRKTITVILAVDIITRFYDFLIKKHVLKAVPSEELYYAIDKTGHKMLENPFTGRFVENGSDDADLIHDLAPEYLYTFIQTAKDVVPDIALVVFLQCFGGLRKLEVISLEYKNIAIKTVAGRKNVQLSLEDKDLREDISTAFLTGCKRNRTQAVLPAFDGLLWKLYESHKKKYQRTGCSAVFVDTNGRPMTDATYYKRFRRLKKIFIERLRNSEDFDGKSYAAYLSTYKWSIY